MNYLLGGHYYDRDNHSRRRHYPAVFPLHHGEATNLEIGPDFLAFDTEFVRYPEDGEPLAPSPWVDRFRATIAFEQLYKLLRKVIPLGEEVGEQLTFLPTESVYYNERIYRENGSGSARLTRGIIVVQEDVDARIEQLQGAREG